MKTLTEECNVIFEKGEVPRTFNESIIYPLHKKGNASDVSNYRGISFLNSSTKIFTSILQTRLKKWITEKEVLSEFQAGFREAYSTVDHIFTLSSIVHSHIESSKKLFTFFVDFKAAFDTVDRRALFYKLLKLGISYKFIKVIQSLYEKTVSCVWDGEKLSEEFETTAGLKQGCGLSPDLFALFIDDLCDVLPAGISFAGIHFKLLLYADDIVIMAESAHSLQLMINRLAEYCNTWNLTVNLSKSKVMIFRRGNGRYARNEQFFYYGERIEVVRKYKYLGILISSNGNFDRHLTEKLASATNALNSTWKNCMANTLVPLSTKYKVFDSTAKSILCYGAQVWGFLESENVEKLLRIFLKHLFRLPQFKP